VLNVAALPLSAQSSAAGRSPRDVVERFCRLDLAGSLLTAAGDDETARFLVSPFRWTPDQTIVVIDRYTLRGSAQITVDYHVWGELDASLRFLRLEGVVAGRPVTTPEYMPTVRSDGWRIGTQPSRAHVSVATAVRHVTAMRDRSTDPVIKTNASQALVALGRLASDPAAPRPANARKTAAAVVGDFCTMDGDGKQLTSGGWRDMAPLFAQPREAWREKPEKIAVVADYGISPASITDEHTAGVRVTYLYVGFVDSKTGRFEQESPGLSTQRDFDLVLADGSSSASPIWKIEGPVPPPSVTVATAISYLTRLRDSTMDPAVKTNADRTLAVLKRPRQGR
jgi:hypothetical protein